MDWNERVWQRSVEFFGEFMEPLVGGLGRQQRREGAALYAAGTLAAWRPQERGANGSTPWG